MRKYDAIVKATELGGLEFLRSALYRMVDDEAQQLIRYDRKKKYKTAVPNAEDFYADEILGFFNELSCLEPEDVIGHRRRPNAWAVAKMLRYSLEATEYLRKKPWEEKT